ncbi:hypothetical protein D8674_032054 [Pyrus ussuriensis x Pyrus communis]|uniref:Uncharacterized protein n=1 Tax=Pyrus ussuriensis x Pyrus communis TaxID=2448454 RepID=A0A5N5FDT3_9ROSA|nr:hypothetical protein D8674_032054 [Pyrus ussuriensis x Pyrus communis]
MTAGLMEAQEREACVELVLPSPFQTTEDSWESSRSVENNMIWVFKFDEILLDLWKPIIKYEFSHLKFLIQIHSTNCLILWNFNEKLSVLFTLMKNHIFTLKIQSWYYSLYPLFCPYR